MDKKQKFIEMLEERIEELKLDLEDDFLRDSARQEKHEKIDFIEKIKWAMTY